MRRLRCRREGTATSGLIAVVSLLAHITSALAFASKPPGHTARFTCSARCAARAGEVTMILDRLNRWKQVDFVLASNSPRRKEILSNILGLKVRIVPSTFEENLDKSKFGPQDYVKENARQKSLEVWKRLSSAGDRPGMVVGGDTVDYIMVMSKICLKLHVVKRWSSTKEKFLRNLWYALNDLNYFVMGFPLHSFCRELSHLASAGFKLQEGN
eukprot:767945-Hanusia_phi.AAC.20